MSFVSNCPNLFGGSVKKEEISTPHIEDQELLGALFRAEPSALLQVLSEKLGIAHPGDLLAQGGFGVMSQGRFSFHSPHHFIDGLENPSLLKGKEKEVALTIISALHTHEITDVISALRSSENPPPSPGVCA